MGNVFASGFQGYVVCMHAGSVLSSIVHTCVVWKEWRGKECCV